MFKEELLNIVTTWSVEQLTSYIEQLETRMIDTQQLIRELRLIRKRKTNKKKIYETGARDGR